MTVKRNDRSPRVFLYHLYTTALLYLHIHHTLVHPLVIDTCPPSGGPSSTRPHRQRPSPVRLLPMPLLGASSTQSLDTSTTALCLVHLFCPPHIPLTETSSLLSTSSAGSISRRSRCMLVMQNTTPRWVERVFVLNRADLFFLKCKTAKCLLTIPPRPHSHIPSAHSRRVLARSFTCLPVTIIIITVTAFRSRRDAYPGTKNHSAHLCFG